MNPPVLQLLPGQPHRVLRGHPWVYSTELAEMPAPQWDGHALALRDPKGVDGWMLPLASGFIAGEALIIVILSLLYASQVMSPAG